MRHLQPTGVAGAVPLFHETSAGLLCVLASKVWRGHRETGQYTRRCVRERRRGNKLAARLTSAPLWKRNNMSITRDLQHDLQQETQVSVQTPQGWCESPTSTNRFWTHWATQPAFARQHENWKDWKLLAPCSLQKWEQVYLYKMGI